MRIAIDYIFQVDLPHTFDSLSLALRLTPEDYHDQTVGTWRIGPDCDAGLRDGRDGFGNILTMLYAAGPIAGIDIHVAGEVFTGPSNGILDASHREPLPPGLFLRADPGPLPALAALAIEAAQPLDAVIDRLHRANVTLHDRMDSGTTAELVGGLIAGARRLGVPARWVSGYLARTGSANATPHVWAEAFVADIGWIGFDPSTGLTAGEDHVRVASALDAAGVAPIAGP